MNRSYMKMNKWVWGFVCSFSMSLAGHAGTHGDLSYSISGNEVRIYDCDETASGELQIPSSLEGYPVTSIGESAFKQCYYLTNVIIPESVSIIGSFAFEKCYRLKSMNISDNVSVVGRYAFWNCSSLTNVTIGSSLTTLREGIFSSCGFKQVTIPDTVTSIGDYAFYRCGLTNVIIPNSVISMGNWTFADCRSLLEADIGDNITYTGSSTFYHCPQLARVDLGEKIMSIGNNAFQECEKLAGITISPSVTSIGDSAFYFCKSLTNVSIGSSVASIGAQAFYNCDGLEKIEIPESITAIGNSAFEYCDIFSTAIFEGDAPYLGTKVFDSVSPNITLYFYEGAVDFTTPNWKGYPCEMLSEASIDFDNDGLPDGWEQQIIDASRGVIADVDQVKPEDDFDRDGNSNYTEFIAGTSPTNGLSVFQITDNELTGSGYELNWTTITGRVYGVWWSTNLVSGFMPLETNLVHPQNSYIDDQHSSEHSVMYQLRVELAE